MDGGGHLSAFLAIVSRAKIIFKLEPEFVGSNTYEN